MYSFAQREDTQVIDEPLYANYLKRTDIDHPGKEEIIQSMETDLAKIIDQVFQGKYSTPLLFIKNMSQHFYGIDSDFIEELDNIIYIRNPKQIIASFAKIIENPTTQDVGIKKQFELFHDLQKQGKAPIILDSGELLNDPEKILQILCDRLDIAFQHDMLSWEPGPRPEDGIWAKYWYNNVHQSTGFAKQKTSDRPLPKHLEPLYEESIEYYWHLYNLAVKA